MLIDELLLIESKLIYGSSESTSDYKHTKKLVPSIILHLNYWNQQIMLVATTN